MDSEEHKGDDGDVLLMLCRWLLAPALCVLYGFLGALYVTAFGVACDMVEIEHWEIVFVSALGVLVFLIAVLCAWLNWLCARMQWDVAGRRRTVMMLAFLGVWVVVLLYLRTDVAPIENDYTLADIPCPAENAMASHETILTFRRGGPRQVRSTMPHQGDSVLYTNALEHAEEIERGWKAIKEGREVIEHLDTFDGIADLAESDVDVPLMSFVAYRNIAQTYWAFCALRLEQGKVEEAVKHLVQLHSVMRKTTPYSRALVRKMICVAIMNGNMDMARHILRSPHCDEKAMAALQSAFTPLSYDDVSIRGPLIYEYLCTKTLCETCNLADIVNALYWDYGGRARQKLFQRACSAVVVPVALNRNRVIHELRAYYDLVIAGAGKCPPDMSGADQYMERYDGGRSPRNILGWGIIADIVPSFSRAAETAFNCKVKSELLAMEMHLKSGKTPDLKDPYTGKDYIIDRASGSVTSAGPDGAPGTEDDVRLWKWW